MVCLVLSFHGLHVQEVLLLLTPSNALPYLFYCRYAAKRFRKAQCPIVERLVNSLMMHGRNNGKKLMTVRIVKHSFEIIHLLTGENPLQVLVNAIINSGPREDSTRIGRADTVRRQAVDVSPLSRVNQVYSNSD